VKQNDTKSECGVVGVLLAGLRPVSVAAAGALLEHAVSVPQDAKPVPLCQYAGKALLKKIDECLK